MTKKNVKHKLKSETLDTVKKGMKVIIATLPDGIEKAQLIRLGITKGSVVLCLERLPGGTIVLKRNRQEIAIGYPLAKKIKFSPDDNA
ncbi:MAG: ferrous iron transport protein A [Ignavibacteriales bacterium]|nr:MAG: ferrous iron transport protein A [Ignavibacteriales bacterium]